MASGRLTTVGRVCLLVVMVVATDHGLAAGQTFEQRGSVDVRGTIFPQEGQRAGGRFIGDLLFRSDVAWRPVGWLTCSAGLDARIDTDGRVERELSIDIGDRGSRRPAVGIRRASVAVHGGGVWFEAGKQLVRWGRTDILNPTDRFAPRDLVDVVDNEVLGVSGMRVAYRRSGHAIEAVWVPRLTPTRLPPAGTRWNLESTRWTFLGSPDSASCADGGPQAAACAGLVAVEDRGTVFPAAPQVGLRWSHVTSAIEYSLSVYDGYDHVPRIETSAAVGPPRTIITRVHPQMRMYGGDLVLPLRWVTIRAEAAYFASRGEGTEAYGLYVVQLERQHGEWFFVGGYAGEVADAASPRPDPRVTAYERGLARTFLGKVSYTIDVNRSVALEGAVRQDGGGLYVKGEYSRTVGQHWRGSVRVQLLRGDPDDFLGQYRRNSNIALVLRFSF